MKRYTEFSRTLWRTVRKERRLKQRCASKYIPQHRDPSSEGDRELRSKSKEIQKTGTREGKPGAWFITPHPWASTPTHPSFDLSNSGSYAYAFLNVPKIFRLAKSMQGFSSAFSLCFVTRRQQAERSRVHLELLPREAPCRAVSHSLQPWCRCAPGSRNILMTQRAKKVNWLCLMNCSNKLDKISFVLLLL